MKDSDSHGQIWNLKSRKDLDEVRNDVAQVAALSLISCQGHVAHHWATRKSTPTHSPHLQPTLQGFHLLGEPLFVPLLL